MNIEQLQLRLTRLEALNQIRHLLSRYMQICDQLNADTDLSALMALFSSEAIWEGVGSRYAASFGRYQGQEAIAAMFQSYMQKAHFVMNAHFLSSEQISMLSPQQAEGQWLMLQTSSFSNGLAHLNAAKLSIRFTLEQDDWKISHFQTENIFSRPVSHWDSTAVLPVPDSSLSQ
jgi:hypothetical protein